ncbi:MAG: BrnT family toxin [Firmicutes bacterium]|nr:BrnT family toxin [Bacillota bacterium]
MLETVFEWDEQKNASNKVKHGISFEEACSVFQDSRALIIPDPDHSEDEERFIILGLSTKLNMLVVCHCYRNEEQVIRIISARKATKTECRYY